MGADDGGRTKFYAVPESTAAGVGNIYQDAAAVHFLHHLPAEGREAQRSIGAVGGTVAGIFA